MGLFSSKTKTTVGTSVSRMIPDDQLPDAVLTGMTNYLVEDNDQMIEEVMEALADSIATRANRMYNYGKDDYMFGLPSGSVHSSVAGKEASQAVLEQETGGPVSIVYYHFGPLNNLHIGWKRLTENYGYDYITNQVNSLNAPGKVVFLKDMQVVVTDATLEEASNGSLDQWGVAPNAGQTPENKYAVPGFGQQKLPTPFAVDPNASGDYILVSVCWEAQEPIQAGSAITQPVMKYDNFTIPLTGFTFTDDWHQVKYVDKNNKINYWIYQDGTGEHPSIDAVFDAAYEDSGHIFPWAYFRYGKVSTGADKSSQAYKDTKKLMSIVNIDADDLIDKIHENPDIADVEQAMLVMAIPADTDNEIEQKYLFDFFSGLYEKSEDQPNASDMELDYDVTRSLGNIVNRSSMIIQDKRFKMALNWRNIIKRKVAGSIGPIGTYASGANSVPSSVNVPSIGGGSVTWDTSTPRHWYQRQINEAVYEEIQIFELKLTYYIFEQYTTTGDETDEILLIPIDISVAKSYPLAEREILYSRGLHFVFNSRVVTKLKWYQTSIFRVFLVVVAVVITVLSYGSTWQTIGAALAAGTITLSAILMALIQQLVKYIILQVAVRLFVKEFGVKVAFIAAIVAAVAGSYQAIDAGSINGAPWAKELLSISTGLTKAINVQLQDDFQDLLGEQSDFQQFVKEQNKLLDTANDLLTNNERLAPLVIFGEKPNDFYQRTIHSGNIGTIGADAVESFVDVALTLPKLSDTINLFS